MKSATQSATTEAFLKLKFGDLARLLHQPGRIREIDAVLDELRHLVNAAGVAEQEVGG